MKKIYFSTSLKGQNADPALGHQVVTYLQQLGHTVLSEHVGARTSAELQALFAQNSGVDQTGMDATAKARVIRMADMRWVDEADVLVAVITGASLGVGMEIERALLKPERGLPVTSIYCFVAEECFQGLSAMVQGVAEQNFHLFRFGTFSDIQEQLAELLQ